MLIDSMFLRLIPEKERTLDIFTSKFFGCCKAGSRMRAYNAVYIHIIGTIQDIGNQYAELARVV